MEITTVVGIVIAVIIMLFGLRILLKKPADATPSLDSELHVDTDSQQPVIPRHVRDQLQNTEATSLEARVEPTLAEPASQFAKPSEDTAKASVVAIKPVENVPVSVDSTAALSTDTLSTAKTVDANNESEALKAVTTETKVADAKTPTELSLNANIEKAEISEFEDESNILDEHLHEQQRVDEESALSTAVEFITLNIYPERRVLSGEKTLKVLLKYGLRFGEMACFHRYNQDDTKLLFSVLQITDEGAAGFDLETLSTEQVKGLAFFLALPHSDVQNAFDTMDSLSRLIAREIDGTIYDQNNQEFTPQLREQWRHQAIDYRAGHTAEV